MTELNKKVILEIADKSPTAEAFFEYAANRKRNIRDNTSNLTQIRSQMKDQGYHPVPQELLSTFRELERAGIGKFRGKYFTWHAPIKEVGKIVQHRAVQAPKPEPKAQVRLTSQVETKIEMVLGSKTITIAYNNTLTAEECQAVYSELLRKAS